MTEENQPESELAAQAARATAYDQEQAEEYDSYRFTKESGKAIHRAERACLFRALNKIPKGSKIIEVGCGTGRLLVEVEKLGYSVDGADASGAMLEQAKAKFAGREDIPEFILCEAAVIPAESNTYDFSYSIRLLNQTESPEYALRVVTEMIRITKPGGHCLIEFINQHRPRLGMNKRETTRLRPKEVKATVEAAGAELVNWDGAFFTSMQMYQRTPNFLLGAVVALDRGLSKVLPRLCSRTYAFVKKANA